MKKVKVECNFIIEVEFDDNLSDKDIKFLVEENSCPGTGTVGFALDELIKKSNRNNTCWACKNRTGRNKVLSITNHSDKIFSN